MNYTKRDNGFTLVEVLVVIVIIGILGAIAFSKLASSTTNARQKADVATGHQVKAALDRYELENGTYPIKDKGLTIKDGEVTGTGFVPKYISKLDKTTTQQGVPTGGNKGFGYDVLTADSNVPPQYSIPAAGTGGIPNTIMIYLSSDGLAAEVRVYDEKLEKVLWTSAN